MLPFEEERRRARRYCYRASGSGDTPAIVVHASGAAVIDFTLPLPVEMLAAASGSITGTWSVTNASQPTISNAGTKYFNLRTNAGASGLVIVAPDSSDDGFLLTADL